MNGTTNDARRPACVTRAGAAALLALALSVGCKAHDDEPAPAAPVVRAAPPAAPPAAAPAAQPMPTAAPYDNPPGWPGGSNTGNHASGDSAHNALGAAAGDEAQKPRDFTAEMTRMLADATSCIKPRPADKIGDIALTATAHVMPSGAVSRGEVDVHDVSDDERTCLRTRVEALYFAAPIENAPFSVNATLSIRPKLAAAEKPTTAKLDALGMTITQAPSGEGVTPGVVPKEDPFVVPPEDPGVVPPADPGVAIQADPGVIPAADPPAEILPVPEGTH